MYKVIKYFTDLQDNRHPYNVGDTFPRDGMKVTEKRLNELSSNKNKRGVALIEYEGEEKVEEKPIEKPVRSPRKKNKKTEE